MIDAERILVRLPNWLGDLLLSRPLLHALRGTFPGAEIRIVGPAAWVDLLSAEPLSAVPDAWPADSPSRNALTERLRRWRPTVALVLPPSFAAALFGWRCRAAARVGFRSERREVLLTHALRRPARGEMHLSDEYLELGRVMGVEPRAIPRLEPPAPAIDEAADLLRRSGVGASEYALMGPGASYGPAKRWGGDRFASVGRSLAARGLRVLVCGTAAERNACEIVAREIGPAALSLAGATPVATLSALCARATLALCNDSGLAHLCAAVGAPTVTIFGSTSSAWTAPMGPRVRVIQRAPVCSPCFQRTCRIGYRCLSAVGVEEVNRACLEVAA